jgi:hypothetical protein
VPVTEDFMISGEGARMSGNATKKLNEAAEALMNDLDGARLTIKRIVEIQTKMSQCMDECLAEFGSLVSGPEQEKQNLNDVFADLNTQNQQDVPQILKNGNGTRYNH